MITLNMNGLQCPSTSISQDCIAEVQGGAVTRFDMNLFNECLAKKCGERFVCETPTLNNCLGGASSVDDFSNCMARDCWNDDEEETPYMNLPGPGGPSPGALDSGACTPRSCPTIVEPIVEPTPVPTEPVSTGDTITTIN